MSRRSLRQVARVSYYEPEEPNLDEYIFCDTCGDYVFEYCSIHGPLLVVPDDKVPTKANFPSFVPRAALTIPKEFLHLAPSIIPGAGLGVFSTLALPRGVRFGPYCGQRAQGVDSMYCWQVYGRDNLRSHVVDAGDAERSNWMRYVNCARHWSEQNLVAFQYRGQLYYRTIKIIPRFTELMVFYGSDFAKRLHIDLRDYNSPSGYAQKFGVAVPKKARIETRKSNSKVFPAIEQKISVADVENKIYYNENGDPTSNIITRISDNLSSNSEVKAEIKLSDSSHKVDTNSKRPSKDEPSFICKICNHQCSDRTALDKHTECHDNNFKDSSKNIDTTANCFIKSDVLNSHPNENHYYKGDMCQSFMMCGQLKTHIRTHTVEKPYKCDTCLKSFTHISNLKKHIRTHTGEKPYKCDTCLKSFTDISNLKTHIRTHTGEKPYKCDTCLKSFTRNCNLKCHIRTHRRKAF